MQMPTPAAIAIVFYPDSEQLVLVHRRDHPFWVLPGGGIDEGETPEEAVVREVKEETGLEVVIDRAVAEYEPINRLSGPVFLFSCRVIGGELTEGDETAKIDSFHQKALPSRLFGVHRYWITDALRGESTVIRRKLQETSYLQGILFLLRHPFSSVKWLLS